MPTESNKRIISESSKRFGRYLLQAQKELKMTQAAFGKFIGLSRNQLTMYFNGASEADLALVERAAAALKKDPAILISTGIASQLIARPPTKEEIKQRIDQLFEAEEKLETLEAELAKKKDTDLS